MTTAGGQAQRIKLAALVPVTVDVAQRQNRDGSRAHVADRADQALPPEFAGLLGHVGRPIAQIVERLQIGAPRLGDDVAAHVAFGRDAAKTRG